MAKWYIPKAPLRIEEPFPPRESPWGNIRQGFMPSLDMTPLQRLQEMRPITGFERERGFGAEYPGMEPITEQQLAGMERVPPAITPQRWVSPVLQQGLPFREWLGMAGEAIEAPRTAMQTIGGAAALGVQSLKPGISPQEEAAFRSNIRGGTTGEAMRSAWEKQDLPSVSGIPGSGGLPFSLGVKGAIEEVPYFLPLPIAPKAIKAAGGLAERGAAGVERKVAEVAPKIYKGERGLAQIGKGGAEEQVTRTYPRMRAGEGTPPYTQKVTLIDGKYAVYKNVGGPGGGNVDAYGQKALWIVKDDATGKTIRSFDTKGEAMAHARSLAETIPPTPPVGKGIPEVAPPVKPAVGGTVPPKPMTFQAGAPEIPPLRVPPSVALEAEVKAAQELPAVVKLRRIFEAMPSKKETAGLRAPEVARRTAALAKAFREGAGEEAFIAARGAAKGKYPVKGAPVEEFTKAETDQILNAIRTSPKLQEWQRFHAQDGLNKILMTNAKDVHIPPNEIQALEKVFGTGFVDDLLMTRSRMGDFWYNALDAANLPRALLASFDLSAPLRQGAILFARHPIQSMKAMGPMVKSFFSEKNAKFITERIKQRPYYTMGEKYDLYTAPMSWEKGAGNLWKREETYMSRLAEKIPFVRWSQRSFNAFLNEQRSLVWNKMVPQWEKMGATDIDYQGLAKLINYATGRGDFPGKIIGLAPVLNASVFSPRLLFSRIQLTAMLGSKSPMVRKEAARSLLQFTGAVTSVLGLAKLAGAEIEMDPRSADFGKMKIGATRLDLWAGYIQLARFIAQFSTAERKTRYGSMQDVTRLEIATRFAQSKASPIFSFFYDLLAGEDYMGEELALDTDSLWEQTQNRLFPLFIQDIMDAAEEEGLTGVAKALPGGLGAGVVTHKEQESTDIVRKFYALPDINKLDIYFREGSTIDGAELTDEEKAKYRAKIASIATPLVSKLQESALYKRLSDEQKAEHIQAIVDDARKRAREWMEITIGEASLGRRKLSGVK